MEMTFSQALWSMISYITISVTLFFLAWTLYYDFTRTRIPSGVEHRAKLRFINLIVNMSLTLAAFLEKIGICHRYVIWRQLMHLIAPMRTSKMTIKDLLFDTVPVRVYWPKTGIAENRRGVVYFHGGGSLFGSPRVYERMCCFIAQESAAVVVCVKSCLAPENLYPVTQLISCKAIIHFFKNAQDYGVDSKRIFIAGDSSGGGHAASICQELVMRKDIPKFRGQVLINPALQFLDFNLPSYQQNYHVPFLFKKRVSRFLSILLTGKSTNLVGMMMNSHVPEEIRAKYQKWISADLIPEEFKVRGYVPLASAPFSEELYKTCKRMLNPTFTPLLAEDAVIQQLPETFLVTAEYDILRDDGLLYKKRLEDNGVRVTWDHQKDSVHGTFLSFGVSFLEFQSSRRSMNLIVQFLNQF